MATFQSPWDSVGSGGWRQLVHWDPSVASSSSISVPQFNGTGSGYQLTVLGFRLGLLQGGVGV